MKHVKSCKQHLLRQRYIGHVSCTKEHELESMLIATEFLFEFNVISRGDQTPVTGLATIQGGIQERSDRDLFIRRGPLRCQAVDNV